MFSRLGLVLTWATLLAPTTASAHIRPNQAFRLPVGPVAAPVVAPALRLAQRVWHPACGTLTLRSETPPPFFAGDGNSLAGWADPDVCIIHLNAHIRWMGAPELCETVLHEAGHVAGFHEPGGPDDGAHSANPNSIMFPLQMVGRFRSRVAGIRGSIITWIGVDWRCRRAYGVYGTN